jgi:hypothetical protein
MTLKPHHLTLGSVLAAPLALLISAGSHGLNRTRIQAQNHRIRRLEVAQDGPLKLTQGQYGGLGLAELVSYLEGEVVDESLLQSPDRHGYRQALRHFKIQIVLREVTFRKKDSTLVLWCHPDTDRVLWDVEFARSVVF